MYDYSSKPSKMSISDYFETIYFKKRDIDLPSTRTWTLTVEFVFNSCEMQV